MKIRSSCFFLSLVVLFLLATAVFFLRNSFGGFDSLFLADVSPVIREGGMQFLQSRRAPGEICVDHWMGRDGQFAYAAIGCGRFSKDAGGNIHVVGDQNFYFTRFAVDPQAKGISGIEQFDPNSSSQKLESLFPRSVVAEFERFRNDSTLYLREGFEKSLKH